MYQCQSISSGTQYVTPDKCKALWKFYHYIVGVHLLQWKLMPSQPDCLLFVLEGGLVCLLFFERLGFRFRGALHPVRPLVEGIIRRGLTLGSHLASNSGFSNAINLASCLPHFSHRSFVFPFSP